MVQDFHRKDNELILIDCYINTEDYLKHARLGAIPKIIFLTTELLYLELKKS